MAHRAHNGFADHPPQSDAGFCAEMGGAITLFMATWLGIPVSTTHTITGAIIGVGAAKKVSAVRWNIAGSIVIAWVITLPAAALISAFVYEYAKYELTGHIWQGSSCSRVKRR